MHSTYNVPIIPQNLRQDETIVQIADALKHLGDVSNDIFSRINVRIELNKQQLTNLTNRINVAHTKVERLTGAKKATQVFSSSKYPAADVHKQYKSIFDGNRKISFTRSKVKFKELQVNDDHIENLQFYHLKVSNEESDKKHVEGLGPIPTDITSVNDLFLYNTGNNPYKNYVISDPLQVSLRTKKEDSKEVSDIGAAPHSISERTTLTKAPGDSYFYSPDLGDVPLLDVPLDLPDLPGIADDLRYVDEQEPGIAPSVTTTPIIPELPLFLDEVLPSISDNATPLLVVPTVPVQLQVETVQERPQVVHNIKEDLQPTINKPVIIQELVTAEPLVESRQSLPKELPKAVPEVGDAHASLMAAIRQAGGSTNAKLKTAEAKTSTASSGDLMADLHAKLQLRRKGISGTKNQENSGLDANSAMTKISAMIPPPLELESTNSDDDDDWDA